MEKQDKFERYILNQMGKAEKEAFEAELAKYPDLKEELELDKEIVQQIRNRAFVDEQIIRAKKEMQKAKTIRLTLYSVVSLAAMVVLVFFIHNAWQSQQLEQLYAANFATYPNDYLQTEGVTRGETTVDSLQLAAINAYEKKDFTTATLLFTQLLDTGENPEIRFYLAMAQLENGQTNEALTNLQKLYSQSSEYRYYEQTRWYLALVHLKLHHKTEAKKYLDELINLEGAYWDKAKELITKL